MYKNFTAKICENFSCVSLQFFRIMKLTVILWFAFFCQVSAATYGQNINLDVKKATLKDVLNQLRHQSGYNIIYDAVMLKKAGPITVAVQNKSIIETLDICLNNQRLTFVVNANTVIIKEREKTPVGVVNKLPEITVNGVVVDGEGQPLRGVTIKVIGLGTGTVTDVNGKFSIKLNDGRAVLSFSSVGFASQNIEVRNKTELRVVLQAKQSELNDVVVVGYGTVKKSDITGSVSSIKAADFKNNQVTSIAQVLQGRASGVQVINSDATPGAKPNIRIRGTNSLGTSSEPLFVIDGYPSNEDLSSINPNDIESIEVLKDASATAIYGSRGANGVILITTKRGKDGKLSINLESYYGSATVTKTLDVMNAREYAEYRNDVVKNTGAPTAKPFASPAILDYLSTHTTNWQDAMFKNSPLSDVQLNLSGGDEKTKFLISGEWYRQTGIVRNTGFTRGNLRFNFDREISAKLKFGLTTVLGRTLSKNTNINTAGGTEGGAVLDLLRINPATTVYDASGNYSYANTFVKDADSDPAAIVDQIGNPIAYAERVTSDNYLNRGQISTYGEYEMIKGLKLKIFFGGEFLNSWGNFYAPYDIFSQAQNHGTARLNNGNRTNWLNENNLTYSKDFGSAYALTILLGQSYQQFNYDSSTASSTNFFTNAYTFNSLGAGTSAIVSSTASQNQLNSYYARVNAKLWTNLLATATLRSDGSSKFGENHKYGYFPSVALAYKLGNLPLMQKTTVINDLKIRAGYGVTGNQEIPPYLSKFGYDLATGTSGGGVTFGTTRQIAVAANRPENPNLKWEQTSSFNVGLDFGLLSNRFQVTADYYTKRTNDLLWSVALPATTGFTDAFKNLGSIENKGFEFSISGTAVTLGAFRWNSGLTLAVNKNKIISLGDEPFRLYGANALQAAFARENFVILQPGQEIGKFLLYQFDGIWQSQQEIDNSSFNANYKKTLKPGYAKYKDLNGDGTIDIKDKKMAAGSAYPKFVFGFTNIFSYHNIEISAFLQGQQGNKILNLNKYWLEYPADNNKGREVLNRWKGPGTSNTLPAAGFESSRLLANDFLEDGSYIRLKTLSLSYQFPNRFKFMKAANLSSLRFYVTGTNLLTLTKYTGFDSEVNSYNNDLFLQGVDQGAYPVARSFIFGIKVGL
jgi:TonB-linked SusC/RagA family outer membrane protein